MPKKKSKNQSGSLNNILIFILAVVVIGFIYSFAQKSWRGGVYIQKPKISNIQQSQLALDIYEANPILNIKVEVLNGCGEKGIAAQTADFLRTEHIDVVRSENAVNFDYDTTILIHRSDDLDHLKTVAKALDFNINNQERVMIQGGSTADVDLTLILGKDYRTIKPLKVYLANL